MKNYKIYSGKYDTDVVKSAEMEGKGRNHQKSEERAVLGRINFVNL